MSLERTHDLSDSISIDSNLKIIFLCKRPQRMRCDIKSRKNKVEKKERSERGRDKRKKVIQRTTKDMTNSIEINTAINRLNQQCLLFKRLFAISCVCVYWTGAASNLYSFHSYSKFVAIESVLFSSSFLTFTWAEKNNNKTHRNNFEEIFFFSCVSDKKIESNDLILFIWNFELAKTIGTLTYQHQIQRL